MLGRHCYFLNLVFFFFFSSDDSASMRARTNIDMTSRAGILYPFVTTCHGRFRSEQFLCPAPIINTMLCFRRLCLGYTLLERLAGVYIHTCIHTYVF